MMQQPILGRPFAMFIERFVRWQGIGSSFRNALNAIGWAILNISSENPFQMFLAIGCPSVSPSFSYYEAVKALSP